MDNSTFYITAAILIASVIVVFCDAVLTGFETPEGFWTVLVALSTYLGARIMAERRNGNVRR